MNKVYLNKFDLISYNLHNGNVIFKTLKNGVFSDVDESPEEDEDNDRKYKFIIEDLPKEYWIVKNKDNKFKILIKSQNIEINSTIHIKAGPFSTIDDARDALLILSNWSFADVI